MQESQDNSYHRLTRIFYDNDLMWASKNKNTILFI